MRILIWIAFWAIVLCGCGPFRRKLDKQVYVRITNAGSMPTTGYRINNHSFPGLKPGDTTEYQLHRKLNMGDEISVIVDSIMVSRRIYDCNNCEMGELKKVTIGIKVIPQDSTEHKKMPLIDVGFYADDRK